MIENKITELLREREGIEETIEYFKGKLKENKATEKKLRKLLEKYNEIVEETNENEETVIADQGFIGFFYNFVILF